MASEATKTGSELERRVADAYRRMGARKVEHDVELAGYAMKRLREVPAIGPKRYALIRDAWETQKQIKEVMVFLQGHGISTGLADAGVEKLALLGFDACLMATYEVASTLAPLADRVIPVLRRIDGQRGNAARAREAGQYGGLRTAGG